MSPNVANLQIADPSLQPSKNSMASEESYFVGKKILVIGRESWFGPLLSKQHIVLELCRENEVIYVEPFFHLGWLLKGKLPQQVYHEPYHQLMPPSLTRLIPMRLPKSSTNKAARCWSEWLMLVQLWLKRFRPDVIISFSPYYAFLAKHWLAPFVFYAVDTVETEEGTKSEADTLAQADLVIAATEELYRRFKGKTHRLQYLPHGVSSTFLQTYAGKLPDDILRVRQPRVGFVGAVSQVIDIPLLIALAQARPDYSIVLVGPYEKQSFGGGLTPEALASLKVLPNVHLLGPRLSSEMGTYIKGFDVGIIPYDLSHPRIHFSYHKVLQYMALGKPVVTTCPASLEVLPPHVGVGNTLATFLDAIDYAIHHYDDATAKACCDFAKMHSWEQRLIQLSKWLSDLVIRTEEAN
ncbi:MAG: glycosyltransferase [Acidobacteria bacterium]|nr:glycosyltransferase [Acidobacteriota bacterium]